MQIGIVLLAISLGFASMGTGVIVVQMRRMSGPGPVLAYCYLACGAAAALPGCLFCGLLFAVSVFRPDRDPQIIAVLYEMGFVGSSAAWVASRLSTWCSHSPFSSTNAPFSPNGWVT